MVVRGILHGLSKDSLTTLSPPITNEPDTYDSSSPYFNTSPALSAHSFQSSEASDDLDTSTDASSWALSRHVGSHVAARSKGLADDMSQPDNAEPLTAPESSAASGPQTSHADPLPIISISAPPIPPPLYIPKRGPIAAIVRRETQPDSPGSPITGVVDLTQQIKTLSAYAFAHGGFADIHYGELEHRSEDGQIKITPVVIKLLRVLSRQDVDGVRARKRLNREVYVWHRLDHPNIAKMFGTSYHMGGRPAMVLEWYQNGNASEYLKMNPSADRKMLVVDIARGLNYLHHTLNPPIVHGDLKGNNVLITRDHHAVLTDFGLSKVIEDLIGPSGNTTTTVQGSVRWMAPELVFDDNSAVAPLLTSSTDVWSFACTAYELLTGKLPYHNRHRDFSVIQDILHGVKPGAPDDTVVFAPRPQDKIWTLLDQCWSVHANTRPRMMEVADEIDKY